MFHKKPEKPKPLRLIVALTDFQHVSTANFEVNREDWPRSFYQALEKAGAIIEASVSPDPVGDLIREVEKGKG